MGRKVGGVVPDLDFWLVVAVSAIGSAWRARCGWSSAIVCSCWVGSRGSFSVCFLEVIQRVGDLCITLRTTCWDCDKKCLLRVGTLCQGDAAGDAAGRQRRFFLLVPDRSQSQCGCYDMRSVLRLSLTLHITHRLVFPLTGIAYALKKGTPLSCPNKRNPPNRTLYGHAGSIRTG